MNFNIIWLWTKYLVPKSIKIVSSLFCQFCQTIWFTFQFFSLVFKLIYIFVCTHNFINVLNCFYNHFRVLSFLLLGSFSFEMLLNLIYKVNYNLLSRCIVYIWKVKVNEIFSLQPCVKHDITTFLLLQFSSLCFSNGTEEND